MMSSQGSRTTGMWVEPLATASVLLVWAWYRVVEMQHSELMTITAHTHTMCAVPDALYRIYRREQFLQWIENLPVNQTPSWLGLPNNAEKVLLTTKGSDMTTKLLKMQSLSYEDDFVVSTTCFG